MPLYEYKCARCGDTFEALQKFSDLPLSSHEVCGGPVERLISRSAFQLKGSGWYATDYAKGAGAKKENGKPETKTETPKADASDSAAPASSPSTAPAAPAPSAPAASTSATK